jgi:hypothetical protein
MPKGRYLRHKRFLPGGSCAATTRIAIGLGVAIGFAAVAWSQDPSPLPEGPVAIATTPGGQGIPGDIAVSQGELVFQPAESGRGPLELTRIRDVRFTHPAVGEPPTGDVWWIHLAGRQQFLARKVALSRQKASFQLSDGRRIDVPRNRLAGMGRVEGAAIYPREQLQKDVIILRRGAELFGTLESFGEAGGLLRGAFGEMHLDRGAVSGIRLKDEQATTLDDKGLFVRAWLAVSSHDSETEQREVLAGALEVGPQDSLQLKHSDLGMVSLSRDRLRRIEVLHQGWRMAIDPRYHHLGNEVRPTFDVGWPEGTELAIAFSAEKMPPGELWLSAYVVELEQIGPSAKYADALAAGHLRTNVVLNGKAIDYLNRYVPATTSRPQRIRLRIPRDALLPDQNRLVIQQVSQRDKPSEYDDCGIYDMALEVESAP